MNPPSPAGDKVNVTYSFDSYDGNPDGTSVLHNLLHNCCIKMAICTSLTCHRGIVSQVWTREAGIQATATVEGYQCFRYVPWSAAQVRSWCRSYGAPLHAIALSFFDIFKLFNFFLLFFMFSSCLLYFIMIFFSDFYHLLIYIFPLLSITITFMILGHLLKRFHNC